MGFNSVFKVLMLYLIYKLDITYKCSCQNCTDDDRALVIKFDS